MPRWPTQLAHKSRVLYYFWDYVSFPALSRHDPSWDHRAIDGVQAARCIVFLARLLEDFRRIAL
jgi:hypothetical protein